MKKPISIFLCLILISMVFLGVAQAVNAASAANMSIKSSAATVYRGDSFTLTVNLSNNQPISNGGIILSYDSNVFELQGGSCNVSNAALAEVSAAKGGGVFVLQTDAVVSGTIFTIKMRVKDNAAFGTYPISGKPSLSIACSLSGTNISVACKHSYANCTKVDDNKHESTCTFCGQKETVTHTWDNGTVTKPATCKETGIKKVTCTGCKTTKEETIPVTQNHTYSKWSQTNSSSHSRNCSVCGKTETVSHNWNKVTVIKEATCQTTGSRKLTCTGCGATKTETVAKTDHPYAKAVYIDENTHKQTCSTCGTEVTANHQYSDSWKHDEQKHFHSCSGCEHKKEEAAHTPGPEATATTDQVCTVCNRILQPKGNHTHSFNKDWSTDETDHWHTCSGCSEKGDAGKHVFKDDCDGDCDICGMTREPPHKPAEKWSADESGHWHDCQQCSQKVNFTPHTLGTDSKVCTVCQCEPSPTPHEHVFHGNGALHIHQCACGERYEAEADDCKICANFPWWILCVIEAVIFGGALLGVFLWFKKQRNQ